MTLPTFPWVAPSDAPRVGGTAGAAFSTEVSEARSGIEFRRYLQTLPRHRLTMDFSRQENAATKADTLYAFFCARKGRAEAFAIFDFNPLRSYTDVFVCAATAGQTVLNLPCRNATSVTVKLDVVTKTGSLSATAGTNGRDRFTLSVGATGGETVTVSFTGQRFYVVRFDIDEMTIEYLTNRLHGGLSFPVRELKSEE